MVEEVENFHGCYLLRSTNPHCKGRIYIGYTVDPNRRINQHNRGLKAGGAWRTSKNGPWEMLLIIYGFPNEISALRFEWAWQHPSKSRRLRHLTGKQRKENSLQYHFRLLSEMLRMGPWNRLPLTIRILDNSYDLNFKSDCQPPLHMPVTSGPVKSCKSSENSICKELNTNMCCLCHSFVTETNNICCVNSTCKLSSHIVCLAKHFLAVSKSADKLLPVQGSCPICNQDLLWGDVIVHSLKHRK